MNNFLNNHAYKILIIIPIISLLMHIHIFKLDLVGYHVWRQTQTQTVINNFYSDDNNIFNSKFNYNAHTDRIVRMEFPIMQWLIAQTYFVFGPDVAISRVFSFITGIFTILGFYTLILNIFKRKDIAIVGAWCFNFSPVFFYYTVNPIPDNFALCTATWSLAFFFKWINKPKLPYLICSAIFISLSTLAKLPFILYLSIIASYLIYNSLNDLKNNWKKNLIISFTYLFFISPAVLWYIFVIPTWQGNGIVKGIFDNQTSFKTIIDFLQHNLISTLPELLINYGSLPLFLAGFYFIRKNRVYKNSFGFGN